MIPIRVTIRRGESCVMRPRIAPPPDLSTSRGTQRESWMASIKIEHPKIGICRAQSIKIERRRTWSSTVPTRDTIRPTTSPPPDLSTSRGTQRESGMASIKIEQLKIGICRTPPSGSRGQRPRAVGATIRPTGSANRRWHASCCNQRRIARGLVFSIRCVRASACLATTKSAISERLPKRWASFPVCNVWLYCAQSRIDQRRSLTS
jgi:hypothetical protein